MPLRRATDPNQTRRQATEKLQNSWVESKGKRMLITGDAGAEIHWFTRITTILAGQSDVDLSLSRFGHQSPRRNATSSFKKHSWMIHSVFKLRHPTNSHPALVCIFMTQATPPCFTPTLDTRSMGLVASSTPTTCDQTFTL